ncbi:hypothetical protein IXO411_13390, partial [Xanthomonas oryzae pv. oryzae]
MEPKPHFCLAVCFIREFSSSVTSRLENSFVSYRWANGRADQSFLRSVVIYLHHCCCNIRTRAHTFCIRRLLLQLFLHQRQRHKRPRVIHILPHPLMQLGEFLLAPLGFDQVRDVADPDRGGVWVVVGVLHFAQQGVAVPVKPRGVGRVAFEHPSAQGIVAVVGDLPCLAAFGQAVVGVPAQFQVVGCGAVGAALANQVAGAVEDVVHAFVRALAG